MKKARVDALCWWIETMACNEAGEMERGPRQTMLKMLDFILRAKDLKLETGWLEQVQGNSLAQQSSKCSL